MDYQVVFDVAEAGYRAWPAPLIGLVILTAGSAWIIYGRHVPDPRRSAWRRVQPYLMTAFGAFWAVTAFVGTYGEHRELATALARGDYETVEGVVVNFVPGPFGGHPMESFEVDGRRYEYSDFLVTAGFNNTQSHGGPMRAGLRVRIADVHGAIARLEVAR